MKKIISIFLSALMAVSVMAVAPISAGAEEVSETEKSNETILAEYFIEHSDEWYKFVKNNTAEAMVEEYGVDSADVIEEASRILLEQLNAGLISNKEYENLYGRVQTIFHDDCSKITLYAHGNGYDVYYNDEDIVEFAVQIQRTEKYKITNAYWRTILAIEGIYYVGYEDNMYSIPEACEMGIADEDELMALLDGAPDITIQMFGDVNYDGLLDINDVSNIQMYLTDTKAYYIDEEIYDYNKDGVVDINDATAIQLALAE